MNAVARDWLMALALLGATVSVGLAPSPFTLWVVTIVVALSPWMIFAYSARELSSRQVHGLRPVPYVSALRLGADATRTALGQWGGRRRPRDLGWMSAQWLAEHRAAHQWQ